SNTVIAERTFAAPLARLAISDDGTRVAVVELSRESEVLRVLRLDRPNEWSAPLCTGTDIAWEPIRSGGALLAVCGNGPNPLPGRLVRFDAADGRVLNERAIVRFKTLAHPPVIGARGWMAVVGRSYKDLEVVALPGLETISVDEQSSGEAAEDYLLDDARDSLVVARGPRIYSGPARTSGERSLAGELRPSGLAVSDPTRHLNWLPDGRWIAAGDGSMLVEGEAPQARPASGAHAVVALSGGRQLALLESERLEIRPEILTDLSGAGVTRFAGDDAEGRGTAFTADSRFALYQSWRRDGLERVALGGEQRGEIDGEWTRFAKQAEFEWSAFPAVHPAGAALTSVDGQLAICETGPPRILPNTAGAWSASTSRDGTSLAVAVVDGVRLFDWRTGTMLREWKLAEGPFRVAIFERKDAPHERVVLALGKDSTLYYLPVNGDSPVAHRMPFGVNGYYPAPIAVASEAALIAAALDGSSFAVYDLSSWPAAPRLLQRFAGAATATALAFSPDAARLAIASDDHRLSIWDWKHELVLLTLPLHSTCASIAFSPDGQWLANTDYAPSLVLRRAASLQEAAE
ncbi:MAG: WD40 repeat domain-containing protein, partial [Verrucomicrobiota bacterium]|nr:WD40 repeat domain-containing protein [Verrucomicrobiota bacterium]